MGSYASKLLLHLATLLMSYYFQINEDYKEIKCEVRTEPFHELSFQGVPSFSNNCRSVKNSNVQQFRLAESIVSCGGSGGPATHLHRFGGTADVQLMSPVCASSQLKGTRQSHVTLTL